MTFALKILLLDLFLCGSRSGLANCVQDRDGLLSLNFSEFDQNLEGGWRRVSAMPNCTLAAADLIQEYRNQTVGHRTTLNFHEGQLRARAGKTERSITLSQNSRKDPEKDRLGWNYYVEATIAFLKKDRNALLQSRDALAALEKPEGFRPVDRHGNEIEVSWPLNLHIVERFVTCFDMPYSVAYGGCQ
jgi:hypothetical protein